MIHSVKEYKEEILNGLSIAQKMKGGYQTLGDRSAYIIKLFKKIKNDSSEVEKFTIALKDLLLVGDEKINDFLVNVLIDGIEFGNLL